jgi:hypothetical protein
MASWLSFFGDTSNNVYMQLFHPCGSAAGGDATFSTVLKKNLFSTVQQVTVVFPAQKVVVQ